MPYRAPSTSSPAWRPMVHSANLAEESFYAMQLSLLSHETRSSLIEWRSETMTKKEISAKRSTLFSLLAFFAFLSFVSVPAFGAQATRDLKEIKIAYPPSLSSTNFDDRYQTENVRAGGIPPNAPHHQQ